MRPHAGQVVTWVYPQEEDLEIIPEYRPTIFVLHHGRLDTGEFRRQSKDL